MVSECFGNQVQTLGGLLLESQAPGASGLSGLVISRLALWCCSALSWEPEQRERNVLEFSGGDSGIRTPDLRIMIADAVKTGFHFLRGAALASTNCTRSVLLHGSSLRLTVRNMRVVIIR